MHPFGQGAVSYAPAMGHPSTGFQHSHKILLNGLVREVPRPELTGSTDGEIALVREQCVLLRWHDIVDGVHLLQVESGRLGIRKMTCCMDM